MKSSNNSIIESLLGEALYVRETETDVVENKIIRPDIIRLNLIVALTDEAIGSIQIEPREEALLRAEQGEASLAW